jgi:Helix-turn-helix domain
VLQPRLLKLAAAAQYMSMSPGKLRAIIQRGELAVIRGDGGTSPWLLDVKDLEKWIEREKVTL